MTADSRSNARDEVCFFDLETGGVEDCHPTIQVAAVAVDISQPDWPVVESYEQKVEFDVDKCDTRAFELNHFDPKVWEKEAASPVKVRADMESFFRRHQTWQLISKAGNAYTTAKVAGHNIAAFDLPRLKKLWGKRFTPFCWWYPFDTYLAAVWKFGIAGASDAPENFRLETLCGHFGIKASDGEAHDALVDVMITIELAKHLLEKNKCR
jgi:DNA polymerase III epsilon subunit-like protein